MPGSTFEQKRCTVFRSTVDDLRAMVRDGGWYCSFVNGSTCDGSCLLVVPSGFMVAVAGANARGLQWTLMMADESDKTRVKATMSGMLSSFSEYKQPGSVYLPLASHWCVHVSYFFRKQRNSSQMAS